MYLKSDRELYNRKRVPWVRIFLVLIVLAVGGYFAWQAFEDFGRRFMPVSIPTSTPMPTPTPAAGFYVSEAEDAYLNGSMGAAIEAYQRALDMEPNQTELYLELARLLVFYGKPERAVEMARQALIRQPESARAWALLGMAYDWLGLTDRAVQFCERAVEIDPTLPEAYAYLAEAYIDNGQWMAANEAIGTAMELDDTNVDVLRNQGYVLENQGNYSGAIQAYRDALEVQENLAHLYLAIGRNAMALQNLTLARDAYADAVAVDPENPLALDRLGWTQLLIGDYESARPNLRTALELDPTLADAYGHLGTLYYQQVNYEDAIAMLKPALTYGEARSRRRSMLFVITEEEIDDVGVEPAGPEVAYAAFLHPVGFETPLRGEFQGQGVGSEVQGRIRFDVMTGRYTFSLSGLPPASSGKTYVGWFLRLLWPEDTLVRTEPIFPAPTGDVQVSGETGPVKGPPIENYYIYALAHYLLDQCGQALPYLEIALRIDPEDPQALRAAELCR
ncbi:MAG: tetratricopeptide repeat protein [Anaerolineae bacterium]